jgi:prepilin-type N-terminal cleavage/methylation domain-containing protein
MSTHSVASYRGSEQAGFTLVELMIALILLGILVALALPSFNDFRERSITRGAADQLVAALADARMQAIRLNRRVVLGVNVIDPDDAWCIGSRVLEIGEEAEACDCSVADPAESDFCNLFRYPAIDGAVGAPSAAAQARAELRGARLMADADFGGGASALLFEPKSGLAVDLASGDPIDPPADGVAVIQSPSDRFDYRLRLEVSTLGRPSLCAESVPGKSIISGYRTC